MKATNEKEVNLKISRIMNFIVIEQIMLFVGYSLGKTSSFVPYIIVLLTIWIIGLLAIFLVRRENKYAANK